MNLNRAPYFDDFEVEKNFQRVLFKPGRSVQTRELNQLQTISKKQTSQFASSIFKNGSQIAGGSPVRYEKCPFVRFSSDITLDVSQLIMTGATSGAQARCIFINHHLFQVFYLPINEINFITGEDIQFSGSDGQLVTTIKSSTSANAVAYVWVIPESTFFVKDNFVDIPISYISVPTTLLASYTMGLNVVESVVSSTQDNSLLDNAAGETSYLAPGADRLHIQLVPALYPLGAEPDQDFIALASVDSNGVVFVEKNTEYSKIVDTLAERTYDESGNYSVIPFSVSLREHLKSNEFPDGMFTAAEGGDANKFVLNVSSGKAYVGGKLGERSAASYLVASKSSSVTTVPVTGNFSGISYLKIIPAPGSPFYQRVDNAYLFTNRRVLIFDGSLNNSNPKRATGTVIGEFYGVDTEYVSNNIYKIFFIGLKLYPGKSFSAAKSLECWGQTVPFVASIWADSSVGIPQIYNPNSRGLLWEVGQNVQPSSVKPATYAHYRYFYAITLNASGVGTLTPGFTDLVFSYFDPNKFLGGIISGATFTVVPLDSTSCTFSTDMKSVSISLGTSYAGKRFGLFYFALRTLTRRIKKSNQTTETVNLISGQLSLSCYDLEKVVSITDSNGNDVTDEFSFTPDLEMYVPCKLNSIGGLISGTFTVNYKYYTLTTTGYYSDIHSYPDPKNIPMYEGRSLGDYIDFRPIVTSTFTSAPLPMADGSFSTTITTFVPRTDTFVISEILKIKENDTGTFSPGEMEICQLVHSPNTKTISDIQIFFKKTQRYTMEALRSLDARVDNLEYLSKLSLMESNLVTTDIRDPSGRGKYKNGIFVDDFSSVSLTKSTNPEFHAAFDRVEKTLRPAYNRFNLGLELNLPACVGPVKVFEDQIAMIDFDEEIFINQPYATKTIEVSPVTKNNRKGCLTLSPSSDSWFDVNYLPSDINPRKILTSADQVFYGEWFTGAHPAYIREQVIKFSAERLVPRTRMYAFFNGVNVSAFCRPLDLALNLGAPLVVNADGKCEGEFWVPAKTFLNGEKVFKLTNSPINSSAAGTYAETVFRCSENKLDDLAVVESQDQQQTDIPLAQAFQVEQPCFVTSVELFFSAVVSTDVLSLRLVNSVAGFPGTQILAEKIFLATSLNTSRSSKIVFNHPVFLEGPKEYMLVLNGNRAQTRIYSARFGTNDLVTRSTAVPQPNMGRLFRRAPDYSWSVSNDECLKVVIHRARFKSNTLTLEFVSKSFVDEQIYKNPFECQQNSQKIRVFCPDHALAVGDTISPEFIFTNKLEVTMASPTTFPAIGQIISTASGSAVITSVQQNSNGSLSLGIKRLVGQIVTGETFNTSRISILNSAIESASGRITLGISPLFRGIPLGQLNKNLLVKQVDSMNSVIVEVPTKATSTGLFGGEVKVNFNKKFDSFYLQGKSNNVQSSWYLEGIGTSVLDSFRQDNYVRQAPVAVPGFNEEISLLKPLKIATKINEQRSLNNARSVKIRGNFTTGNNYFLSPVVDIATFSVTGICNSIDQVIRSRYEVEPNSDRYFPETSPLSGVLSYKYISKEFVLINPALDLKIFLQVHKPQDSDFDIYLRTRPSWVASDINTIDWIKVEGIDKNFTCTEEGEFHEVSVLLSETMPEIFGEDEFSTFQIKIVGMGINTAQPVLFKLLRAIALT